MRLRLRVLNAPEGEQNFTIDPPGGLLGRSLESVACLPYDSVSRQHAEVRYDGQSWWLQQHSQNSLTLLDDQSIAVGGAPVQLLPRGTLKLGRVALQYWQEAVATQAPDATAPLASEATMILPRRAVAMAIPPAMLAQMSPVRVAESASAEAPAILTRQPTASASTPLESPPTMILRPAASASTPPAAPTTLIRRSVVAAPPPPPLEALSASSETPLTVIMRPGSRPTGPAQTQPARVTHTRPVVEHQPPVQQHVAPQPESPPAPQPDPELAKLRSERERLTAEVTRLKRENAELRATRAALQTQLEAPSQAAANPAHSAATPPANLASLSEKALELLHPFGRSLEQAGEALRQGDAVQARGLLRSASFALADLRDLFQP